jgi:hypothetical protein
MVNPTYGIEMVSSQASLDQDWQAVGEALSQLGAHTFAALGLAYTWTGILQWLAVIAAIYLLVLDRTNWRTNLLTALLVPYLALQLPEPIFGFLRGNIGLWIAFIAVVIRLFFASQFPQTIHGDLELPASFILLIVTAPTMLVAYRRSIWADAISLIIGAYLMIQHINNAGGCRPAFSESRGVSHTIGIILLFVAPLWAIFHYAF